MMGATSMANPIFTLLGLSDFRVPFHNNWDYGGSGIQEIGRIESVSGDAELDQEKERVG